MFALSPIAHDKNKIEFKFANLNSAYILIFIKLREAKSKYLAKKRSLEFNLKKINF